MKVAHIFPSITKETSLLLPGILELWVHQDKEKKSAVCVCVAVLTLFQYDFLQPLVESEKR